MASSNPIWPRLLAAALAGALCAWIAPPANWHLLHWFAWLPLFWALKPGDTRGNIAVSWTFGAFALAFIFRWVVQTIALYSNIPMVVSWLLLLLGAGLVFGWLYVPAFVAVHPLRRAWGVTWIWLFPFVLVATEFLVGKILIFPWQMGVAHYRVPEVFQIASVTGVLGVSWLVALSNALFAELWFRHQEGRPLPLKAALGVALVFGLNAAWGTQRFNRIEHELREVEVVRMAQLQSPHDMVFRMSRHPRESLREWVARTRRLAPGAADIVVWPEGASPYDLQDGPTADLVARLAKRGEWEMIVGGGARMRMPDPETGEIRTEHFNSVYVLDVTGEVRERYDKMVPLVFGEYLPRGLKWLHDYVQGIGDFRAGDVAMVYTGAHGRYATPICYEAIFPGVCRQYEGAQLLINVTNDAWFGQSAATHQHGMLAAIRATELGVTVFRSTYSGTSFVVEPHGHVHAQTDLFEDVARVVPVRLHAIPTLYGRFGDWFGWLAVVVAVLLALVNPWRRTLIAEGSSGHP